MRRTRFTIALAGGLLAVLCLLHPPCWYNDELFGIHFIWLFDALKGTHADSDYVIIGWLAVAIEVAFVLLISSVMLTGTYLHRSRAVRLANWSVLFAAIVGALGYIVYWSFQPNFVALLWIDGFLLIYLIVALFLVRTRSVR